MGPLRIAVLLLATPLAIAAQGSSDIFVAELSVRDGRHVIGDPVSATRREGYDNQPWFLHDGSGFLYVSQREGQTDVFHHDLATGRARQVTRTPENEYSPSLTADGALMLVVRWAADMSTGALWWYSTDGTPLHEARGSAPRVGYYARADERTLALFINDSIQSFILSDTVTADTTRVGAGLGGSGPRAIPGERAVSFLRQDSAGTWWLSRLELESLRVTALVRMLEGVSNYTWTAHGSVLAGQGGAIYEWRPGGEWTGIATFSDAALQGITRIAISPAGDRIAFVSAAGPP
jgi:hypothetical protein